MTTHHPRIPSGAAHQTPLAGQTDGQGNVDPILNSHHPSLRFLLRLVPSTLHNNVHRVSCLLYVVGGFVAGLTSWNYDLGGIDLTAFELASPPLHHPQPPQSLVPSKLNGYRLESLNE